MASWYQELKTAMEKNGDDFEKRRCTRDEISLKREFDDGFGSVEGVSFTAWGEKYVYFPICYDGSEWVGCAPRNPCNIHMDHQGGG